MMVDTLTIARELRATDLPSSQAEAIASAIGRSVSEGAATKADLEIQKQDLKASIEQVRTDLERMRSQLLLWVVSTQVAVGGLIIAIIKL